MTARAFATLATLVMLAACQMPESDSQIEPEEVSETDLESPTG